MQLRERRPVKAAEVGLLLFLCVELPLRLCVGSVGLGVRIVIPIGGIGPACAAARPAFCVKEELPDLRTAIAIPFFVFPGKRLPATRREIEEGIPAAVIQVAALGPGPTVGPSMGTFGDVALMPDRVQQLS